MPEALENEQTQAEWEEREWQERQWAAQMAAAEELNAEMEAESKIAEIGAKLPQLTKESSGSYKLVFLILLLTALFVDLIAAIPILGWSAKLVLVPLYCAVRFAALRMVDPLKKDQHRTMRNARTFLGGLFGIIPFLPSLTVSMIMEWIDKGERVRKAEQEISRINGEISRLRSSV